MKILSLIIGIILVILGFISLIPGLGFIAFGLNISNYIVAIILLLVGGLLIFYSSKK